MDEKKPGSVSKESEGYKVQFDRRYNCNVLTLWDAITNPAKMAVWFMKVDVDLSPGGKMTIYYGDENNSTGTGWVTVVETGKVFEYIWENEEEEMPDEVTRWELFAEGPSACRLLFTHTRIDEKYRHLVPSGWHIMLDHLEEMVGGSNGPFTTTSEADERIKNFYKELINKNFNHG